MKKIQSLSEKDFSLIERHFDYCLNEGETDEFYQRLETSPIFETQVNQFKQAHEAALNIFQRPASAKDVLVKPKIPIKQPNTKVLPLKRWLAMAASFIVLLGIAYWTMIPPEYNPTAAITASHSYLQQVNLDDLSRSERNPVTNHLPPNALVAVFTTQDYTASIQLTDKAVLNSDEKLIRAISFLELKELEKAKTLFLEIINTQQGQQDIALWGLVNIYLKQGDTTQAKIYLKELATPNRFTPRINTKAKEIQDLLS